MLVRQAKELARQWVLEEGSKTPDFAGAFYHGSTGWLDDSATLPATSDLDVMVVLPASSLPPKPGKFSYRGVLLEVSYLSADRLQSPAMVLGEYNLAGSFRTASIIADPAGWLTTLQSAVAQEYAQRRWVRKRSEQAKAKVLNNLRGVEEAAPFHDQVAPWLFAAGVTTHILLVAGLKNPTVRRRYVAVRELLAEYGHLDFYETLLDLLGCTDMSRERVEHHLTALADIFDATKVLIKTPVFYAADISDIARPVAIDGSWDLIRGGYHREAVFWIVATYSRCQKVLYQDAPREIFDKFNGGYYELLADLGISSFADLMLSSDQIRDALPQIWAVAEAIMAANPDIED